MSLRKDLFKGKSYSSGSAEDSGSSLHKTASVQEYVEVLEEIDDEEGENSFGSLPTTYVS